VVVCGRIPVPGLGGGLHLLARRRADRGASDGVAVVAVVVAVVVAAAAAVNCAGLHCRGRSFWQGVVSCLGCWPCRTGHFAAFMVTAAEDDGR